MSNAPYVLPDARWGLRMGDKKIVDSMVHDGLTCSFENVHMGTYGNRTAEKFKLTREAQDEWSAKSHERALKPPKKANWVKKSCQLKYLSGKKIRLQSIRTKHLVKLLKKL